MSLWLRVCSQTRTLARGKLLFELLRLGVGQAKREKRVGAAGDRRQRLAVEVCFLEAFRKPKHLPPASPRPLQKCSSLELRGRLHSERLASFNRRRRRRHATPRTGTHSTNKQNRSTACKRAPHSVPPSKTRANGTVLTCQHDRRAPRNCERMRLSTRQRVRRRQTDRRAAPQRPSHTSLGSASDTVITTTMVGHGQFDIARNHFFPISSAHRAPNARVFFSVGRFGRRLDCRGSFRLIPTTPTCVARLRVLDTCIRLP